jgi:hypothetical protein
MIFVIVTQKDRRIEEILFDQQNPNSNQKRHYSKRKPGKNNYKQLEKFMRFLFIVYFGAEVCYSLSMITFEVGCTNLLDTPHTYAHISLFVTGFNCVVKSTTFLFLIF